MNVLRNLLRRKLRTTLSVVGVGVGISLMVTLFTLSNDILGQLTEILDQDRGDIVILQQATSNIFDSRIDQIQNGESITERLRKEEAVRRASPMVFSWMRTESKIYASNQIDFYGISNDHPVTDTLSIALDKDGKPLHLDPDGPLVGEGDSFLVGEVLFNLANDKLPDGMKLRVGAKVDLVTLLVQDLATTFGESSETFGELSQAEKEEHAKRNLARSGIDSEAVAALKNLTLRGVVTAKQRAINAALFFPLKLAQDIKGYRKNGRDEVTFILVDLKDSSNSNKDAMLTYFNQQYPSVRAARADELLDELGAIKLVNQFNWAVSIIAALAGVMGVMNILILSVTERTREIGLLRALGWSRRRVVRGIIAEGVVITMLGAALGVLLGYLEMLAVIKFLGIAVVSARFDLAFIGVALVLAFGLGVLASLYPAWRASRLTPMDALRQE